MTTGLVLQDSKTIELMTNLRQVRLTTVLDLDWYEFTISSNKGASWMKHCMCQVKADGDMSSEIEEICTLSCEVPTTAWYAAMKVPGLSYGPAFQKMTKTTAGGTVSGDAVAIARGKMVFRLKGGRFSPLENQVSTTVDDSIAVARLEWMPDVDFM